jgi:hypothetical protein
VLRQLRQPVPAILSARGLPGLEELPGVGAGLARAIRDIVHLGYLPMLERLRGESEPVRLFRSIPGIGPRLAARLHDELGLATLEELEAAAHDGRLEDIAGFGPKRLDGVRSTLAARLARVRPGPVGEAREPPVSELLDVDREYRDRTAAGTIAMIAPRRFNPQRRPWLPILHTSRGPRHYTVLFSNTARAHRLGRTGDWVVIYCDQEADDRQWTVVTGSQGLWRGRRIVRGREVECAAHYGLDPGIVMASAGERGAPERAAVQPGTSAG